jgi:hypothetical protein
MTLEIRRWFTRNPYTTISLVLLAVLFFGWRVLGWDEREFGFMLLIYFIITIGVRLDEISRTLGGSEKRSEPGETEEPETVLSNLKDIKILLAKIRDAQERAAPKHGSGAERD